MTQQRRTDPTAALIPQPGQATMLDYVPASRTNIAERFDLERARIRSAAPFITELRPAQAVHDDYCAAVLAFSAPHRQRKP